MLTTTLMIILTAFCTASLSRFIDYCFEEDNILHGYFLWLQRKCKCKFIQVVNQETKQLESIVTDAHFLYYPLGGCIVCMSFWLTVPAALFVCKALCMPLLWSFFIFWAVQALNFFFLQYQIKLLS